MNLLKVSKLMFSKYGNTGTENTTDGTKEPGVHDLVEHSNGARAIVCNIVDNPYSFTENPNKVLYVIGVNLNKEGKPCSKFGDHWGFDEVTLIAEVQ